MDKWLQCLASGLKSLQMVTFGTWLVVWKTEHLSASDTVVLKKKKKKKLFGNHWSKESEYFFPNWDLDKRPMTVRKTYEDACPCGGTIFSFMNYILILLVMETLPETVTQGLRVQHNTQRSIILEVSHPSLTHMHTTTTTAYKHIVIKQLADCKSLLRDA